MDTACRIDNDTNIDLARFMLLDGTDRVVGFDSPFVAELGK